MWSLRNSGGFFVCKKMQMEARARRCTGEYKGAPVTGVSWKRRSIWQKILY